jgi:aerobic-type carbon monoxide dehydrogenase small subunit (CoxS/CutS family)
MRHCTPGILMAAKALLDQNPHPTRDEIRAGPAHLCRCTGYVRIIDAVENCAVTQ